MNTVTPGNSLETIRRHGGNRDLQYAQLGVFLCAHCHILPALWDGKDNDKLGGTVQTVRFHHDDVMPGYTPDSTASSFILADDESDLVYHIVCSRDRQEGQPATPSEAGNHCWFSLDIEVCARQLPANAGPRSWLDSQCHAGRRNGV